METTADRPTAARKRWDGSRCRFQSATTRPTMNHSQTASAGRPRSAAIWMGTLCRWGFTGLTASGTAVLRVERLHHVRPDADQRMVLDHEHALPQHGDAVAIRRILQREDGRVAVGDRRGREQDEHRRDNRQQGQQAAVLEKQQQRGRRARPDAGVAREAERHGNRERRDDERGPHPVAPAKQHAGQRGADDEHQQARVRHVVSERSLRPASQVVVVEHAELHDAHDGAGGREGHDHRDHASTHASRWQTGTPAARAGTGSSACPPSGSCADRVRTPSR